MSKIEEHLASVVALINEIGDDAEAAAKKFGGDVEGHLRVAEAHLKEIVSNVRHDFTPAPVKAEKPEPKHEEAPAPKPSAPTRKA